MAFSRCRVSLNRKNQISSLSNLWRYIGSELMGNENGINTKRKAWSYGDGTIVVTAILVLGFAIEAATGGVIYRFVRFPWNFVGGLLLCGILAGSYFLWKNHKLMKWLGSVKAALPAILGFTFLVLMMGVVEQNVQPHNRVLKIFGLIHLVRTWPFILVNAYLLLLLGIIVLKRFRPFNPKNAGFFLNHFGLFLVLFATSLGSADLRRLTIRCYEGRTETSATNEAGKLEAAPFSVRLLKFNLEEYRPRLALVDRKSGKIVSPKQEGQAVLPDRKPLDLNDYHIELLQFLDSAVRIGGVYQPSSETGSAPAARLSVVNRMNRAQVSGWVCCGSFNQPAAVLPLSDDLSLVMLTPDPERMTSELEIATRDGSTSTVVVSVNKSFKIDGWNIYQFGYHTDMGRWSDSSVLELIRDPWLPVVYAGILLMMAGAVFLFILGKSQSGGAEHVA
jgi:hypothetical protein